MKTVLQAMKTVRWRLCQPSVECMAYVAQGVFFVLGVVCIYLLVTLVAGSVFAGCGLSADEFVTNVCKAYSEQKISGNLCPWLCDSSANNPKHFQLCPRNEHHVTPGNLMMVSSPGAVFSMSEEFYHQTMSGYKTPAAPDIEPHATYDLNSYRKYLSKTLNTYLNQGDHDAILNSMFTPSSSPVPASYIHSLNDLFKNKRFILSLLFYGSGDLQNEAPGLNTESVPIVSHNTYCGGLYQSFNFINNTTPLALTFNRSSTTSWSIGPVVHPLNLKQVIIHLLDIEEATAEHEYEGEFYMCHLNASQLLLHNKCVRRSPSLFQLLDGGCTVKVLDISNLLYSRYEVSKQLRSQQCISDRDCGFFSCMGQCQNGFCDLSPHTRLAGLLQICDLIHGIEDQALEGQNSTVRGQLFTITDRCLDLAYFPLDTPGAAEQLQLEYNIVFQDLKLFFINLHEQHRNKVQKEFDERAAKRAAKKV